MSDKNSAPSAFFNQYFPILVCGNVFMGSVLGEHTTLSLLEAVLSMAAGLGVGLLAIPFLLAYVRKSFPARKVALALSGSFILIQIITVAILSSCATSHPSQLACAALMGFNTGMFGRGLARSFS